MTDIAARSAGGPQELEGRLSPEVAVWVRELRTLWQATGMSLNRFAAGNPIDKGTLSRYLNGKRVPRDHWLLDRLLAIQAEKGKEVAHEVREHLTRLQLEALKVAHPHEYRVRLVSDELEIAVVGQREAERYAHHLEQQLAGRIRQVEELTHHHDKLQTAWDIDRVKMTRLQDEIADLTRQLEHAHQRTTVAEEHCQHLEELLNQLQTGPLNDSDETFQKIILTDPNAVATLLDSLRRLGVETQAAVLAERAAAEIPLDDPAAVAVLLNYLRELGAEAGFVLAERAAAEIPLDDPVKVAVLLDSLRRLGVETQAAVLAERAAAGIPLDDPAAVALLLESLRELGAEARLVLAERAAAEIPLDDPAAVALLLNYLRMLGAETQAAVLAERAAAEIPLDDPAAVAVLLNYLRMLGAETQAAVLAERAAAKAPLDDPAAVALRRAGSAGLQSPGPLRRQ